MAPIANEFTYFDRLPIEVLVEIFAATETVDLIIFCKAYPQFLYLCEEKKLMNVVDLSRPTVLMKVPDFLSIVSKKLIAKHITVFNMNYIYWTPAGDIRKCLKKLINLEELYLLGTKMRISQADCDCYNTLKLRKIAVPIQENDLLKTTAENFEHVESLCVQIIQRTGKFQHKFQHLIKNLKNLRELWIDDISHYRAESSQPLLSECEKLKIFVFKGPLFSFYSALESCPDLKIILLNDLNSEEIHAYLEINKDLMSIRETADMSSSLRRLLMAAVPGLSDGKALAHRKKNFNNILFEELNLKHDDATDSLDYHDFIYYKRSLIFSNNSRFVKKLSLETCLFEDRPEHGPKIQQLESKFKDFLGNVNELEVGICHRHEDLKIYYMLQHLSKLTHLYLEIPIALDGKFLKSTMEKCELLHTLNIQIFRSNESFCQGFYRFISLAKNLRNLRFDHCRISFERLFFALSSIKNPKMETLYLNCEKIDNFGLDNMRKFVKRNPNLNIMAIACHSLKEKKAKILKNDMKSFMNSPEKVFMIRKSEYYYDYPFSSKDFCKFKFLSDTLVSTINIFEEFPKNNLPNKI